MKKRVSVSTRLAEEVINEIMMAGIAFFLVIIGINYFSMRWAWTKVLSGAASAAGFTESQAGIEVTKMLAELSSTFPFKYLFVQYDFWGALFIAVLLSALGIWLKLSTVRRGGKFFIDLGKNIYSPAVIGFILIIVIHIWLAFNVNEYVEDSGMPDPGIGAGFFVWEAYGQLFLFAAAALIIGAVIKLIGEKNDQHVKMMVGETVFNGALLLLLYYLLIRVFALDVIMQSTKVVQLFIISNQYSSFSIAVCIFLFTFGRALKEYGIWLLKREHAQMTMAKMKERYRFMHDRYGAEVMPRPGPGSVHHPALPEQPHPHYHPQHSASHMAPLHREESLDSLGHKPGHKPHEMHNAHKKHKKQR